MLSKWISAARPRTLPTSLAPVILASAYAWSDGTFDAAVTVICALFAVVAQIASNFGNDYFDYKNGSDRADRVGPRRAVASGDITPKAMLIATVVALSIAALLGCLLLPTGGWPLFVTGCMIVIFSVWYSAGPYPLSYHGLGEITVFIFFGLVPVTAVYWLQGGEWCNGEILAAGAAMGLLSVDILLVNNYRDVETDKNDGKMTSVVIFGRKAALAAYLLNGIIASVFFFYYSFFPAIVAAMIFLTFHIMAWRGIRRKEGTELNAYIGRTAMNQVHFTLLLLLVIYLNDKI